MPLNLGNCAVCFVTAYNVPGQMHRSPGWNLGGYLRHLLWKRRKHKFCLHNCASADILINDGAKTLTRNVQSNEKINNSSVQVTVHATVASKTRILKTANHRHAVSRRGCVFFIGHGKKGLCADFLVHAAGAENLMIIFFFWPYKKNAKILQEKKQQQTVPLVNPSLAEHNIPCPSKQCRSRSVGF